MVRWPKKKRRMPRSGNGNAAKLTAPDTPVSDKTHDLFSKPSICHQLANLKRVTLICNGKDARTSTELGCDVRLGAWFMANHFP